MFLSLFPLCVLTNALYIINYTNFGKCSNLCVCICVFFPLFVPGGAAAADDDDDDDDVCLPACLFHSIHILHRFTLT